VELHFLVLGRHNFLCWSLPSHTCFLSSHDCPLCPFLSSVNCSKTPAMLGFFFSDFWDQK
jgi:hypothetical protein